MSGEAILSAENGGKPLAGRGSAPNPDGGAHSAPPGPLAGGKGMLPLPRNPRRSRPLVVRSWRPMKTPGHFHGGWLAQRAAKASSCRCLAVLFFSSFTDYYRLLFVCARVCLSCLGSC